MTREISRPGSDEKYIVSNFFTLRLVAASALLGFSALLVFVFPYPDTIKFGVVLTTLAYLFLSLSQVLMGVFQKHLAIYKTSIAEIVARAAQVVLVWIFFVLGFGVFAFLGAVVIGSALLFFINLYFARKLVPFSLTIVPAYWKRIIVSALPIAVSLVFTLLYFKVDTIMLSLMKPVEDVGIYNAAYKVLEALIFFPAMFVGIMMPFLSRSAITSREEFRIIFHKTSRILFLGALPAVTGGVLLSSSVIHVIGGGEFAPAFVPLQILFLAVGIIFFGSLGGNSIVALSLQKKGMIVYFIGMAVNIIANFIVIPRYSYIGASWTTVGTELLVTALLFIIIWKHAHVLPRVRHVLRVVPAVAVMGLVVGIFAYPLASPLPLLQFFGVFVLGWILYIPLLVVFRAVTLEEIRSLVIKR